MMELPVFGEIGPIGQMFALAFILSMVFGVFARKTEFCPLGGIADIMQTGNSGRLRMYFFAIAVAILGITLLEASGLLSVDNTRPPYRMAQFNWPGYLIGGLLFGVGMTLCRGCGMKNMINLGSGNLKAVVAILGMGSAAVILLYVEGTLDAILQTLIIPVSPDLSLAGADHQDLGSILGALTGAEVPMLRLVMGLLVAAFILYMVWKSKDFRSRFDNILGGLAIGAMIVLAYYLSGGPMGEAAMEASDFMDQPQNGMGTQSYTFIRPMGDLLYVLSNPAAYLVTFGLVAFLGVGAGSLLVSIISGSFRLQWFGSVKELARYAVGGLMVGVGGILGMGCTLGQGIAGTSTLAMGSFLNLTALIIGAVIGIKMQSGFMDDHVKPSGGTDVVRR